jgi:hypothetical protein
MTASTLFFLLIVLACPLMMVFMMRGMHGGRGAQGDHDHGSPAEPAETSVDDLRRRRAELDRMIDERESAASGRELTSWGGGRR